MYSKDTRTVLTLDAGGQSFSFSAMRSNSEVVKPVRLIPNPGNLEHCLATLVDGFTQVSSRLSEPPVAISFAFPGPADYPQGIIGNLPNFPAFTDGVPLKAYLEHKFGLPTFINNDGDLFAYGEALAGFLPYVNRKLEEAGSVRRYKNLIGITLGTGLGCGVVQGDKLNVGDNAAATEVWCMHAQSAPDCIAEDTVNSNAVIRVYRQEIGDDSHSVSAQEVYDIAKGSKAGNRAAALRTFEVLGSSLGNALANILAVVDGLVVIGGGVANAHDLFMPHAIAAINGTIGRADGSRVQRIVLTAYNVEDEQEMSSFLKGTPKKVTIAGTDISADYDPVKRVGIGVSKLGDLRAMSIGAYSFALHRLDKA
ncbi:MAG: ROK family protein [Prevotellaceae bacterium]|jgi:glucokinase|nr:ROK family protein [Prevotellaceae bacterium]